MRIRLNFSPNVKPLSQPIDDYVNGFVHKCLGPNNKWHDAFSPYCVSQMQGGVLINGLIQYPNGGHLFISSDNDEFLNDLFEGLFNLEDAYVQTMKFIDYNVYASSSMPTFDMIRIECVRLIENGKSLTFKNDEHFLEKLRLESVKKLKRCGISDNDAESIKFIPFHEEKWREKYRKIKNEREKPAVLPTSNIMIILKGNRIAREKLNNLGYGQSTGCGCGFAKMKKDNNN